MVTKKKKKKGWRTVVNLINWGDIHERSELHILWENQGKNEGTGRNNYDDLNLQSYVIPRNCKCGDKRYKNQGTINRQRSNFTFDRLPSRGSRHGPCLTSGLRKTTYLLLYQPKELVKNRTLGPKRNLISLEIKVLIVKINTVLYFNL